MDERNAIEISGLKKMYKLGQIGGGTLQGDLQSWWARIRGKEDPNSKIGSDQRSNGKTFMALNGIDLTVRKGEALGIIGHNGAGKSTLLKLLSQVTAPTEGTIDINGRIASMLEVGTGFNGEMTGRENVYMNGAILGMTKAEVDAKMEQIIEFSEVREFIDTPVKRYSSGMYVKLAFSVAAHLDSEIMIMDEVLAVGDMAFQKKCLDKMREAANQEGRTVLYVSHNMNTIRQLCDRCIVLDKGRVVFEGDVESAIQVYMEKNSVELSNVIDFTQMNHFGMTEHKPAVMEQFTFARNRSPHLSIGEDIHADLSIQICKQTDDLCLRAMVYHEDEVPVGMTTTLNGQMVLPIGIHTLRLSFPTANLAPGKYYLKLALYAVDNFGNNVNVDVVDKAVWFQIDDANTDNKLTWLSRWWGHVRLPQITVSK